MPPQIPSDHSYGQQTQPLEAPLQPSAPASPPPGDGPRTPVSRRTILRSVAGVGAVGVAAAAGAGAILQFDKPGTMRPVSKPVSMAPMAPGATAGPLVVYITDASTGVLDVFAGTGATQIRNPALVNQLLANLKLA